MYCEEQLESIVEAFLTLLSLWWRPGETDEGHLDNLEHL